MPFITKCDLQNLYSPQTYEVLYCPRKPSQFALKLGDG